MSDISSFGQKYAREISVHKQSIKPEQSDHSDETTGLLSGQKVSASFSKNSSKKREIAEKEYHSNAGVRDFRGFGI